MATLIPSISPVNELMPHLNSLGLLNVETTISFDLQSPPTRAQLEQLKNPETRKTVVNALQPLVEQVNTFNNSM